MATFVGAVDGVSKKEQREFKKAKHDMFSRSKYHCLYSKVNLLVGQQTRSRSLTIHRLKTALAGQSFISRPFIVGSQFCKALVIY